MHFLYSSSLKISVVAAGLMLVLFLLAVKNADAAITNARDTLTTSRPSPSSPLNAALATSGTQATIFNNGSRFLASDSAKLIKTATTAVTDASTIVSSQSAALTTVFFGEQAGVAGHAGADVLYTPITAMHTITLTIGTEIPDEGDLIITFPTLTAGDADNDASPSASTFQFNNLVPGGSETNPTNISVWSSVGSDITANVTVTETEPTSGAGGRLSIEFDSGPITAGTTLTIFLGCATAASQTSCSSQVPRIINPTKSTTAGSGDTWKLGLVTQNASSTQLESTTVAIATIETVTIRATVDPTLSFTIAGIDNGLAVNTSNTGCSYNETTNAGINATTTEVNLGVLTNTPAIDLKVNNISAQRITVETNGFYGYTLTATSAASLFNPSTGFFFTSATTPQAFPASADFFGLHACGNDVQTGTGYVEGGGVGGADCDTHVAGSAATECHYAWPTTGIGINTTPLAIASDTSGPIGAGTGETGDGVTSISYAAGTDVSVPPGEYQTVITYIATPAF